MNRLHRWYCHSAHWQRTVARDLFDWTIDGVPLGDDLLELGGGAGTATVHLRRRASRVTAIDIDQPSLVALRVHCGHAPGRFDTGHAPVQAVRADAVALPFDDGVFSSVATFVMLHHVEGTEPKERLLSEARRVLRPGGAFVGSDTIWTLGLRLFHIGDVFAPVTPDGLARSLQVAGFDQVAVSTAGRYLRWHARRRW